METVSIESRTWDMLMTRIEQFVRSVEALCQKHGGREMKKWLTGQEACLMLNISKRTLQSLRDSGRLAYTQVNRTMFYKPEDVERLITLVREGKEVIHE
jgi:excisionase family DNA binding protein